jgi:hypothetical protein
MVERPHPSLAGCASSGGAHAKNQRIPLGTAAVVATLAACAALGTIALLAVCSSWARRHDAECHSPLGHGFAAGDTTRKPTSAV